MKFEIPWVLHTSAAADLSKAISSIFLIHCNNKGYSLVGQMFSAQAAAVAAAALAFGLLMKRPRKKTVVVMGATTDIGAAVVRALRKDGRFRCAQQSAQIHVTAAARSNRRNRNYSRSPGPATSRVNLSYPHLQDSCGHHRPRHVRYQGARLRKVRGR